jgi:hypothetical protein
MPKKYMIKLNTYLKQVTGDRLKIVLFAFIKTTIKNIDRCSIF